MRLFAAGLLALAVAASASGCGQTGLSEGGDTSQGKELFISKCGGCHKLQDAGTRGTTGPDLDGAFAGSKAQNFKLSTIEQVVYDQIYHAADPMPRELVTGADAASVAKYVAAVAAEGSASEGAAPTLTGTTPGGGGGGRNAPSAEGAKLFQSLGCSGCHSLNGGKLTGPPLNGLFGSKTELSTGQSVTANEAYLLESILDPDKQVVKGFPKGVMSATIKPGSIPQSQAKALVAFLKSQK